MRRLLSYIGCFSLLFLSLASCEDEKENINTTGVVRLGVEKNEILYTKAGVPVTDEILNVSFIDAYGDIAKYFDDYKTEVMGEDIILPSGTYNIEVSSKEDEKPQWDTPFYYGETEVNVVAGASAKASVECFITNTKITVDYSADMDDYFSDYNAEIEGKSGSLTFEKGEKRGGYYFTETLSVTLNLTNKSNGLQFQFKKLFPDIQPRYHYTIRFDLGTGGEDNSGGDFDIIINETDSTEIEYTILIPEYVQLSDMPKIPEIEVTTQFPAGEITDLQHLEFAQKEEEDAVEEHTVTIHTQAGIRNLYMRLSDSFEGLPPLLDLLKADEAILNELHIHNADPGSDTYRLDLTDMVNHYLKANESSPRNYSITLTILDKYHQETETTLSYTVKPDLPLMTLELTDADRWATFAVLKGFGSPLLDFRFKYGKPEENESEWMEIDAEKDSQGNLAAFIRDLEPVTEYAYKVTSVFNGEEQEGETFIFTTCGTPVVPNMSFDDWYKSGKVIYPVSEADFENNKWWDSGNEGGSTLNVNPTTEETDIIVSGSAAKLDSDFIGVFGFGKFAAGNIFIGDYIDTDGTKGAKLRFGKEYTGKPTKLTGYLKYKSGAVNYTETSSISKGDPDQCHIYIALTTKAYDINTSDKSTLFDPKDNSVIAYGEFISGEDVEGDEPNGYQKFEIDLTYKDLITQPTHIVLVASASRYGDYFSGSTSSVLYLDEFELHFDYNEKSFAGTNSVLENK